MTIELTNTKLALLDQLAIILVNQKTCWVFGNRNDCWDNPDFEQVYQNLGDQEEVIAKRIAAQFPEEILCSDPITIKGLHSRSSAEKWVKSRELSVPELTLDQFKIRKDDQNRRNTNTNFNDTLERIDELIQNSGIEVNVVIAHLTSRI